MIKYQNFNESKGISDVIENELYKIWINIKDKIEKCENSSFILSLDDGIKVKNSKLNWIFTKNNINICNANILLDNSYIDVDKYLNNIEINLDIKVYNMDDEFLYYIESVLFHELLHLYQHYNIKINSKFRSESFSIGSILPQLRKNIKTNYGNYILDILYFSLSHELSAQLHQYYFYKRKDTTYSRIFENNLKSFILKKTLSIDESNELKYIKNNILNSIKYYSTNKKYIKNISKSLWNENNIDIFLNKLSDIVKNKVKWIDKKIELIDSKIIKDREIRYDETISLPTNWDQHDIWDPFEIQQFIVENLNDCKIIDGI